MSEPEGLSGSAGIAGSASASPRPTSGSATRFAIATDGGASDWLSKAARGEPVTAGERNAWVTQAGACMDALADPSIVRAVVAGDSATVQRSALAVPRARYYGPVSAFNGQDVPVIGSVAAPPEWFQKRGATQKTSAGMRDAGSMTWADLIAPNNEERRSLWLATARLMQSLQTSGEVVSREQRPAGQVDAGLAPVLVGAIVVGVVALVGWGIYLYEQSQVVTIRESQETARQAAELQAAQAAWLQRVQYGAAHPGQPLPPPSPAEQRVTARPYPSTPSPAEDGATTFLNGIRDAGVKLLVMGGVGLVVVTAAPPVIANLADRATKARAAYAPGAAGG